MSEQQTSPEQAEAEIIFTAIVDLSDGAWAEINGWDDGTVAIDLTDANGGGMAGAAMTAGQASELVMAIAAATHAAQNEEPQMAKQTTAAERRDYYSTEATERRIRAAQDVINTAQQLTGRNGVKVITPEAAAAMEAAEVAVDGGPEIHRMEVVDRLVQDGVLVDPSRITQHEDPDDPSHIIVTVWPDEPA